MLKGGTAKTQFFVVYCLLALLQFFSAYKNQLFGDEAFYWLESQYLAWSYAELPGWTQWSIAFSEWLFPQHELTVRLPSLIAALLIPWMAVAISKRLTEKQEAHWQAGLLMLALPLLAMAGTLAIPDVWLVFFGVMATWLLIICLQSQERKYFIFLGVILALGVNVHVRFWLLTFIACCVVLWHCRRQPTVIKNLFIYSLPIMLVGLIPILWFNLQHDFPLFSFQLKDRHPWQFQSTHFSFILKQILVTTPLVFGLCFLTVIKTNQLTKMSKFLIHLALWHWLIYAVVGFFSDNLRFNVHWPLISYTLILIVAVTSPGISRNWLRASIWTGYLSSFSLLVLLMYWLHPTTQVSQLNAQITANSRGWDQLANKTLAVQQQFNLEQIVADNFMTLAELQFYLPTQSAINALPHPLNYKHGRQQQLELMSLIQNQSSDSHLLVVEHTALKLEEQIAFYQSACKTLNGLNLIDSFDYNNGIKTFYFFTTGGKQCQLPPVSYYQIEDGLLTGWLLSKKDQHPAIKIKAFESQSKFKDKQSPLAANELFSSLDPDIYQLIEFKFNDLPANNDFQLKFIYADYSILSPRIFK